MTVSFTIAGKPFGKQRPKFNGRTRVTYTPAETKHYETVVKYAYLTESKGKCFDKDKPLALYIAAYYPIPQSTSGRKRKEMLEGKILPTVKPDYDNVEKTITDALNGIAFHDDKQIVRAVFEKWYGNTPETIVTITDEF